MMRKHVPTLIVALAATIAAAIVHPLYAIFLGNLFDSFTEFGAGSISGGELLGRMSDKCLALLSLGTANWILSGGYFTFWLIFGELQARSVHDTLFAELLKKNTEWFETQRDGIGALLSRIQVQISELQMATSQPLGLALQFSVRALAALGLAFYTSWRLTLVTLAAVPLCSTIVSYLSSRMQYRIKAQKAELANASKLSHNAFTSISTVKCFNGQWLECRKYAASINHAACHYLRQAHLNASQISCVRLTMFGMFVQGFWYGSSLVASGNIPAGDVLKTFWACLVAVQSIEQVLPQVIVLEKGKAAGVSLKAIMQQSFCNRHLIGTFCPRYCEGDIEIKNVSFAYPSRPESFVLQSLSLFFPAGETTFIVGRSGSGKSTLASLLTRSYPPTSGEILIDGRSIETFHISWVRNNITLIQQQGILFNETIFRNIAFGRQEYNSVTKADVQKCIDLAMLRRTIENLPDGLETAVTVSGNTLSGGQKQQVAIARARLRDTPILILDECTSALDCTTSNKIMESIRDWRKGKTTIIITHDMSQILDRDFVYVLEHGSVVCSGYRNVLEKVEKDRLNPFFSPKGNTSGHEENDNDSNSDVFSVQSRKGTMLDARIFPVSCIQSFLPDDKQGRSGDFYSQDSNYTSPPQSGSTTVPQLDPHTRKGPARVACITPDRDHPLLDFPSPSIHDDGTQKAKTQDNTTNYSGSQDRESLSEFMTSEPRKSRRSMARNGDCPDKAQSSKRKHHLVSMLKVMLTIFPKLNTGQRVILILGLSCTLIHATATPMFSYVLSQLLQTFYTPDTSSETAMNWSLAILVVAICDTTASYLMHYLLEYCGQVWVDSIRKGAMSRILDRPQSWFEGDENRPSSLTTCLDQDAEEMRNIASRFAGFVLVAATIIVIASIWSVVICWKLTLVGLASGPAVYAITKGFEKVNGEWEMRRNNAREMLSLIFSDTFSDIRSVRALALESYFHKKHAKTTSKAMKVGLRRAGYSGLLFGLADSAIIFVSALVFYYGAVLVSSQEYTTKDILTVFSMLLFSIGYASTVLSWIPQMNSTRDSANRLLRLANLPQGTSHEHIGNLCISDPVPIGIADINFSYPSRTGALALRDLSLRIPANSCTTIVGHSGSGKSTIASLLMRLYAPPAPKDGSQTISVGGVDILQLHTPTLRSLIAIVPQHPTLFPASVGENICYGLESSSPFNTMENMRAAAQAVGIDDFIISLPEGYSTAVGDGGLGLSGGQAQRLTIARALVRRPRILILDEVTSSLDAESAAVIRQTVQRLVAERQGLTIIIISHSKEMMAIADNVVVIDQGTVIEEGPYRALAKHRGGKLREMLHVGQVPSGK